nr:MAG TPA: hypothetical protein [Caudoviricetes sp.]
MTREEVRLQLKENPLRWISTRYWWAVTDHCASLAGISCDAGAFYTIREEFEDDGKRLSLKLYLCTMDATQKEKAPYRVLICEKDIPLEDMKQLAEDERLEYACRILGINE